MRKFGGPGTLKQPCVARRCAGEVLVFEGPPLAKKPKCGGGPRSFPVQQRAYLSLATRGGGLELRLGMPWAGRSERALHTLGARFGDRDLTRPSDDEAGSAGSAKRRRRSQSGHSNSRGDDEDSANSRMKAPDELLSSSTSSSSRRPSTPRGYRSVLRLHRSGALCVILERVGVGEGGLMQ